MDTIEDGTPVTPPVTQHSQVSNRSRARRAVALGSAVITAVALTLVGSALPAAAAGTTWYVDQANGADSQGCGESSGPDACATIGAALDQATDGDTVSIADGTYAETLTISDAIDLQGNSQDRVVLESPSGSTDSLIIITADGPVGVSGMTIQSTSDSDPAVQLRVGGTAKLSQVTLTGNADADHRGATGVATFPDSALTLDRSTVTGFLTAGVGVGGTLGLEIRPGPATLTVDDSHISDNAAGILLVAGTATISGGSVSDNTFVGLMSNLANSAFDVTGTSITSNGGQMSGTDNGGVVMRMGGTFTGNGVTISDNGNALVSKGSGTITLTGSTVTGNGGLSDDGTPVGHGILAHPSDADDTAPLSVTLSGTEVSHNTAGLELLDAQTSITDSTIADNATVGIAVQAETTGGAQTVPEAAGPAAAAENPDTPSLTLTGSTVTGNGPASAADVHRPVFGGLAVSGLDAVLTNTDVTDNTIGISAGGSAQITVTGGSIAGNAAGGITPSAIGAPGGADPAIHLTGTSITGNGLDTGGTVLPPAGIVMSGGTVTGEQVSLSGNGNGILILGDDPVTLTLTDSVVSGSTDFGSTDNGDQQGPGSGSGIVVTGRSYMDGTGTSRVTLTRTEVSDNDASGLWLMPGSVTTVTDSTIAGNAIGVNGRLPGNNYPGEVPPAELLLAGSTIAGNTDNAMVVAAGLGVTVGGSILQAPDGVSVCTGHVGETLTDGGWNLASDDSCGLTADSSSVADAQVGALADNGGPTRTMLPGPSSPAVNAIDAGATLGQGDGAVTLCGDGVVDQRGTARPQGSACDAGAVERTSGLVTVTASDATMPAGGPAPEVTADYTGFAGGDTIDDLDTLATCGYDEAGGTTSCQGAADDFYDFAYVPGTLTVVQPPSITTTELPDGYVGGDYHATLAATGGGAPVTWQVTGGRFPTGLILHDDGRIEGTPQYGGQYRFTVTATGALGAVDARDLTLTITPPPCTEPPFPDVPVDSPYCAAIAWITGQGISTGYTDGWFHPERPVTRQTMAGFLYRYTHDGAQAPACSDAPFDDVPVGNPFCGAIEWLVTHEVTTGYGDGTFRPTKPVTTQTMAALLYRWQHDGAQAPACSEMPFADVPTTNPFCGAIAWVAQAGIAIGDADGYHPADVVTRGPMARDLFFYDQYREATVPR